MNIESLEQALGFKIPIIVPIMLFAYMAIIIVIGLWAARKVKNSEDWFIGGRSIGPWITALSHGSTSLGGGFYIAGPQFGWEAGMSALWAAPGDVFGPALNFGLIARRMRRYTEKSKALTIPDFFEHRYYSKAIKHISVIILMFSMLIALLVEYMAMGILVSCITGLSYSVSLYIGCVVILLYTVAGGYLAVAYTDFVQALVMVVGLLIMIPICIKSVYGFSGLMSGMEAINPGLPTLWGEDFYLADAPFMIAGIALVYFIGYLGQPHLVIKTVAIKNEKSIKMVPLIGGVFGFILAFGVYLLGMIGRVEYPDTSMLPGGSAEYIMPMLALSHLPAPLAGLILAGATAAIMSTASSLLLILGTSVGNDLVGLMRPDMSEGAKINVTRFATYILGLVAGFMGMVSIFQIGIYQLTWVSWSILSPAFIPCIVGGLYWKRGNRVGAAAAMISGSITGFVWYYTLQEDTQIHTFFAALVVAIVAYIIGSLVTKKPPQDVIDMFDYARGAKDLEIEDKVVPDTANNSGEEETADSEPSDSVNINVLKGLRYTPDAFLAQMARSKKMAGVKCSHVGTIYSLCWVFQIRIGLRVTENTVRYGGYYAGFDESTMTPGKVRTLPSGEEITVTKDSVLPDKVTEKQALKEAWEVSKQPIIRKFRQLKSNPIIDGYEAERLYKPLYVFEFTSPDGQQKKYKAMDSLTGDLMDVNLK